MVVRGKSTDGPISKLINRRISMRITRFILDYNLKITPNQVSIISFLISIFSYPLYVFGEVVWAGVLVQLASIIDGVDGELARALGVASRLGAFFDAFLDRIADIAIVIGMASYLALHGYGFNMTTFTIVLGALSGCLMVSYLHSKSQQDLKVHPALVGRIPMFASRDVRLFIVFIGSITGLVFEALLSLFILTYSYSISKFAELIYIFKHARRTTG